MNSIFYIIIGNLALYEIVNCFTANPITQGYAHAISFAFLVVISPYIMRIVYRKNARVESPAVPKSIHVYQVSSIGNNALTLGGITGATILVGDGVLEQKNEVRDAVLLHEVGHARESHTLWIALYIMLLNIALGFIGNIYPTGATHASGFIAVAPFIVRFAENIIDIAVGSIPLFIGLAIARYFEKRADMYACRRGYALPLADFLIDFTNDNEQWWYARLMNLISTHPLPSRRYAYLLDTVFRQKGEIVKVKARTYAGG